MTGVAAGLEYLVLGGGLAFAAVLQPGPLQAFLLSRAAAEGWRRTLPAAFSPLLSDGPIALIVLLVVGRLPETGQLVLRAAGGVLLLALALSTLRRLRQGAAATAPAGRSAPRTLLEAATVNLLNPNPWIAWALVMGPALIAAWRESPACAFVLVGAFYGVMVTGLAAFIVVASSARLLPPRAHRVLVATSALLLGALGAWQIVVVVRG